MFGKKRIEELEAIIGAKNREISDLKGQVASRERQFEKIQEIINSTDPDCKPGPYCRACVHSKAFAMRFIHGLEHVYLCNKNGGCKNFVQEEPR